MKTTISRQGNISELEANYLSKLLANRVKNNNYKTGVINDPLSQTHSLASSEHCFHFVMFCQILKSGDGRTYGQTYGRMTCAKNNIPIGRDCGSAEWIHKLWLCANKTDLSTCTLFCLPSSTVRIFIQVSLSGRK